MYFAFLSMCVMICELFYPLPDVNNRNISSNYFNSNVGYVGPFELLKEVCESCYKEWLSTYVGNASHYTSFLLFTRNKAENYRVLELKDIRSWFNAGFNSSRQTKILIHGWLDNGTNTFAKEIKDAYLLAKDVNVISVDWGDMASSLYPLSRSAVEPIGKYTAALVDYIVINVGQNASRIHLVGHSLGAQIAGVVGEHTTFGNLTRITGLDPAAPLFGTEPDGRLDSSDAKFVDVVHTTWDYLGYSKNCGAVDFFPNQGSPVQPGCGMDVGFCSHRRAYKYFAESITSYGFIATKCDSWSDFSAGKCQNGSRVIMGENVDSSAKGDFYLHTHSAYPYASWNSSGDYSPH